MIISRGGVDLNRIWNEQARFIESDEIRRRGERQAAIGDFEAEAKHYRSLARSGRDFEFMKPHVERYIMARRGRWGTDEEKGATENFHRQAAKFNKPAGIYLKTSTFEKVNWKRPDDERQDHISHISALHSSMGGSTTLGGLDGYREFRSKEAADTFHHIVKYHYPDTKVETEPYDGWDDRISHRVSWLHQEKLGKRSDRSYS